LHRFGYRIEWKEKGGEEASALPGDARTWAACFQRTDGVPRAEGPGLFSASCAPDASRSATPVVRSIDSARRASYFQFCQEVIEIFDLQLGKSNAVFSSKHEQGKNTFDLFEVFEGSSVRLLVEIGLKGIGQLDLSPWNCQRRGILPLIERKPDSSMRARDACLKLLNSENSFRVCGVNISSQTISLLVVKRRKSINTKESRVTGRWLHWPLAPFPTPGNPRWLHQYPDVFIGHQVLLKPLAAEDHLLDHGGAPRSRMLCCRKDPVSVSIAS